MFRGGIFLATTALSLLAAQGGAAADEPAARLSRHRVGVDLGLASAVGSVGIGYQLAVVPWLRVEAGAGWGPTGTQLSLMPKLAFGGETCRFTSGAGASLALGGGEAITGQSKSGAIPWLNLDVAGVECRSPAGFSFQGAIGLTMALADIRWEAIDLGGTVHSGDMLPQGRMGVGWWF